MKRADKFDKELQELAGFARVISHPARLAILQYLAETKTCISGDISDQLPLSRTTVSQHLKELRDAGLIQGTIEGVKINYCLCNPCIIEKLSLFDVFFNSLTADADCTSGSCECIN
jgi:predicted transcriptional regulator